MPVRYSIFNSPPATLLIVSAIVVHSLTLVLTGCGASSTANEWSWVNGNTTGRSTTVSTLAGNAPDARYSWTDGSSDLAGAPTYASNRSSEQTEPIHFWEFTPATELWSWVGGTVRGNSPQDEIYVASMPELSPVANRWDWVNDSGSQAGGTYSLAATVKLPGPLYRWTESWNETSERLFGGQVYASEVSESRPHFWEFSPATEIWSWATGTSTRDRVYLASMPELTTSADNAWTWVSGSNTMGPAVAATAPGARCFHWIERGGDPSLSCGDDLQAGLNDYYRYGP